MNQAKVEDGQIVPDIKEGMSLPLTTHDVYLILGIGKKPGPIKQFLEAGSSDAHSELFKVLKFAKDKWMPKRNKKKSKSSDVPEDQGQDGTDWEPQMDDHRKDKDNKTEKNIGQDSKDTVDEDSKDKTDESEKYMRSFFTSSNFHTVLEHVGNDDEDVKRLLNDDIAIKIFFIEVFNKLYDMQDIAI
jgi:hypothetical protein